ncbi:hypothetical protein N9S97_00775 [Candidatus Pelagibacter sp.]|nr:hypothetical protein [Candidatus Pelagibacter sp.]
MKKILGIVVLGFLWSNLSYANILNIKCRFDEVREIGLGSKIKKNWFSSFKDKMGYQFDINNLKLIETSYGKYSQKLSLPINIKNDPEEKDYNLKTISGTFSSIPKSNQKGALTIFVYKVRVGVNDEIFYENGQLSDIKVLVHSMEQYRVTGDGMNEWLNFSYTQSYDDFKKWINNKDKINLRLASGWTNGSCEVVN